MELIPTVLLITISLTALAQVRRNSMSTSETRYSNKSLGFRYTPPSGMQDKTERFRAEIQERAKATGATKTLKALLAMSSGPDDTDPNWFSLTIETYPRTAVSDSDDAKAEARMNAWVADSGDESVFDSTVISNQRFSVSIFGRQQGTVRKAAVVWTTVRKQELLSFAFVANSPEQLKKLTESMKTLEFY